MVPCRPSYVVVALVSQPVQPIINLFINQLINDKPFIAGSCWFTRFDIEAGIKIRTHYN